MDRGAGSGFALHWTVRNAARIRIRRTSPDGPPLDEQHTSSNPAQPAAFNASRALGPFTGSKPVDATYEIAATNRWNAANPLVKTVTVRLRRKPQVKIVGMEISQAAQHFDLFSPAQNNNVRLVAGKKTMVRVYVDSGCAMALPTATSPILFR
jgi:hypothetical protein